uniref:Uncharacterized protein n=1 Tax=Rhizophora mucronata TaxID=61149 RepID=A0A2P2JF24_RHIMU
MKYQRKEEQIQSMKATLKGTENEAIIWDLSAVILDLLLGFERRNSRNRKEPVENAIKSHEIVRGIDHTNGRDSGPGEEGGSRERDAGKQEALESEDDGRVLKLDPLELKGGPDAD